MSGAAGVGEGFFNDKNRSIGWGPPTAEAPAGSLRNSPRPRFQAATVKSVFLRNASSVAQVGDLDAIAAFAALKCCTGAGGHDAASCSILAMSLPASAKLLSAAAHLACSASTARLSGSAFRIALY